MRGMYADTKRQSLFLCSFSPSRHQIPFGTDFGSVPFLVLTIVQIEVVVMVGQSHKIFCSRFFIQRQQRIRIPLFSFPFVNYILKSELGRMAIFLTMILVLIAAFLVHSPGIPVTAFGLTLRPPVCPDAEL